MYRDCVLICLPNHTNETTYMSQRENFSSLSCRIPEFFAWLLINQKLLSITELELQSDGVTLGFAPVIYLDEKIEHVMNFMDPSITLPHWWRSTKLRHLRNQSATLHHGICFLLEKSWLLIRIPIYFHHVYLIIMPLNAESYG